MRLPCLALVRRRVDGLFGAIITERAWTGARCSAEAGTGTEGTCTARTWGQREEVIPTNHFSVLDATTVNLVPKRQTDLCTKSDSKNSVHPLSQISLNSPRQSFSRTSGTLHAILVAFAGGAVVPSFARPGAHVGGKASRDTVFSRGAGKAGRPVGGGTNSIRVCPEGAFFEFERSPVVGDDGVLPPLA